MSSPRVQAFLRMLWSAVALLQACTDDALVLGATHEAIAEGPDAAEAPDGGTFESSDAGVETLPPLNARFQANGRSGVVRLEAACAADCSDVTVVVEGGVPPYEVVWDDGETGATRRLCVDPSRVPSVVVSDARRGGGGLITLGLNAIRSRNCSTSGEGFLTCFAPERRQVECAGQRREVFELGNPKGPGTLIVELGYEPTAPVIFQVDATFSETGCSEESPIAGWPVGLGNNGSALIGSLAADAQLTGAFLTFTTIAGFPIVPTLGIPFSVQWMEICEQAAIP